MRTLLLQVLVMAPFIASAQATINPARDLVNPFVGTGGHGHTFPGACVPNGLVQLSPDTRPDGYMDWDGCGGYHYSDSSIYGFSHTHLSGTGVADLCDVLLMPMAGRHSTDPAEYRSRFSHARESAHAGYYQVRLEDPQVDVELTAAAHTGVHRYGYPADKVPYLVIDLRHRDKLLGSSLEAVSERELAGHRRSASWARDQQLFFVIRFSRGMRFVPGTADSTKAVLVSKPASEPLIVKVGISAVSIEGARANLDAEVPHWDFDKVRAEAEAAWNAKLRKVQPQGGTPEQQRIFHTALYHTYVAPYIFSDVDGSYRGMDGRVHKSERPVYTVFSLWDTFRALHPLMTILEPAMTSDWINTFLLHYKEGGRLPVWELWGNETDCMIGYHSVSVIADAYLKGIRGFDEQLALEAMVASAMRDEPGLDAYRTKGYISSEDAPESVSKTLEYAYDDWCIARMAEAMGRDSLARVFFARSRNWQNLFDPNTHFFRARYNGGFKEPFDPYEVNFNFTEANAWQYSLFVPHDLNKFQSLWGSGFYAHLNELFSTSSKTTGRDQADITGLIGQYAHGNEPSHHMAYLYRGGKGPDLIRRILNEQYHDRPGGLSGNEDCGQMSAWYVMSAMGLYPAAPGCDRYWTGISLFDKVDIALPNGKTFTVHKRSITDTRSAEAEPQPWPSIAHAAITAAGAFSIADGPRADPKRASSPFRTDLEVLPAAIITAPSPTFIDPMEVVVTCVPGPWTLVVIGQDGAERKGADRVAVNVDITGQVQAYTLDLAGRKGPVITAHFKRIEGNTTLTLATPYANQYAAGGAQSLVDGIRGGTEFRTGEWQGFEGTDVSGTIDLGEVRTLKRAGLSVLQDPGAWIFHPAQVQFAWSINGRTWDSATVVNRIAREREGAHIQELVTAPIGKQARYIKFTATNAGPCPDWHAGKGGKTWIFADEVVVELE